MGTDERFTVTNKRKEVNEMLEAIVYVWIIADFGGAAEVAFVGKRDEHFQLVDHASQPARIRRLSARAETLSCRP